VYARRVGDRTLTFGVSGLLVRNSLVMYDHETGSLWSHLTGQALAGPLAGQHLQLIASTQTSWGTWRRAHPETLLLDFDPSLVSDPYYGYYRSHQIGFARDQSDIVVDPRLDAKATVLGLRLEGHVKAYSLSTLAKDRVVDDLVGDVPVVVVFDGDTQSGAIFRRDPDGKTLTFRAGSSPLELLDMETGSTWDGIIGKATSGPLRGTALEQIPITFGFWFAWSDFYPETDLFA
jgi:hypothetical protein